MDTSLIYQKIGEFVVSFQWLEHRLREIGWLIIDPKRNSWPPKELRDDTNVQLLNKIETLYIRFLKVSEITDKEKKITSFKETIASLHGHRKYRNLLLHSAYIEIHRVDDSEEIWRSNPKLKYADGDRVFDTETLTPEKIDKVMLQMAHDALTINKCYNQALQLAGKY
ncbi:hypothetical protein EA772_01905 [Pedobacter sp. G11]|uniref:hypothetical protein n=1 Tax=Pedobacter sp. G11 TaxID=2482728 RepID=UPI000F602017|nr:hypothetical protein [Pedobacter sp. G11]AZI24159.1 hypothetical protein EA772_01905 [Pedobacter sp. G11]